MNLLRTSQPRILDLIYSTHLLLQRLETTPRDYGTGDRLYSSELHTVEAVARNPGCNLTELAKTLEVSKPAASKFAAKLRGLGYLTREHRKGNEKELSLRLTDKGEAAAKAHETFESRAFEPLIAVEARLSRNDKQVIRRFLLRLHEAAKWNKQQTLRTARGRNQWTRPAC